MCEAGTYVPLAEAARLLETTEMRILMMLKRQELVGRQDGDAWLVEKASLHLCGKPKASEVVRPGGCGGCGGGGGDGGCGGH